MNALEFREAMLDLPLPPAGAQPPYWDYWRSELRRSALADDVANFTCWPTVYHNMLADHLPVGDALALLADADARYAFLPPDGLALVAGADPRATSLARNDLWQAGFIRAWEAASGRRVNDLARIVEFGGGFGAMARLCRRLGFAGDYRLYDFPELGLLQRWYLEAQGVPASYESRPRWTQADLLIALGSLSEAPLGFRVGYLSLLECDNFLFYYPPRYEDLDNERWFSDFADRRDDLHWKAWQLTGLDIWVRVGWR